jgi:hypothetical protein
MPHWLELLHATLAKGLGQMVIERDRATSNIKRIRDAVSLLFVMSGRA